MPDVTLRAILTGSSAGAVHAFEETGAAADTTGGKLGKLGKDADETHGRLGSMFKDMGGWVSNMGLPFGESIAKIGDKFEGSSVKGTSFFSKLSSVGGIALAGLAVGVIGVGAESLEMADKFETAQSMLQVAIKNSGGSFAAFKPQLDDTYASMAKLGFNSTEVASALTPLITATGSTQKAMDLMSIAANLARLKHIDLGTAASILTKTMAGSTRALTQLGLNLDIGSAKLTSIRTATQSLQTAQIKLTQTQEQVTAGTLKGQKAEFALENAHRAVSLAEEKLARDHATLGIIMDKLREKTDGAAAAYGKTLPGQMAIARAEVHNLGTELGEKLTPIIEKVIGVGTTFLSWVLRTKPVLIGLGIIIGGPLTLAIAAFVANTISSMITGLADAVTSLFGFGAAAEATGEESSMAFGPIGVAIMAVVVIGTLLATHWKQISKILEGVWHEIKAIALDVWHGLESFFKTVWNDIKTVFMDATIIGIIMGHWTEIRADAVAVWNALKGFIHDVWGAIKTVFEDASIIGLILSHWDTIRSDAVHAWDAIVSWLAGIPGDILHALGDFGSLLLNAGENVMLGLLHGIEHGYDAVLNKIKGIGHDISHVFSDVMSIFSPSKVFMSHGEMLMQGLALGIEQNAHLPQMAMSNVASQLKLAPFGVPTAAAASAAVLAGGSNTPQQGATGCGTPAGAGTAAGSGRDVSVTVNAQTNADPHQVANEVAWVLRLNS